MKHTWLRNVVLGLAVLFTSTWAQADILKDFDSLGGNDALLDQAQAVNPETEVRVVQERVVSRRSRFEFAGGYTNFFAGDTYLATQSLDLGFRFHVNPRVSLGAHYFNAFNGLTSEGEALQNSTLRTTAAMNEPRIPDFDPIQDGYYGSVNFYPFYGKLNVLGMSVVHFDTYVLGGYGNVNLKSGATDLILYGGGIGFWLSQHLSTRLELRQQVYEAKRYTGDQRLNVTVGSLSIGYLL